LSRSFVSAKACVRHVPKFVARGKTQSPFENSDEDGAEMTSKAASLPPTAAGLAVPRYEVKGGLLG